MRRSYLARIASAAVALMLMCSLAASPRADDGGDKPEPAGKAHVCTDMYPGEAQAFGLEGRVQLAFTIRQNGGVADPLVEHTSGSEMLDLAAIACVRTWGYKPATRNNQPVDTPWHAIVEFRMQQPVFSGAPRNCAEYYGVQRSDEPRRYSVVVYHVLKGAVTDELVVASSGSDDLDRKALDCVKSWQFAEKLPDGSSNDGKGSRIINWSDPAKPFLTGSPPLLVGFHGYPGACRTFAKHAIGVTATVRSAFTIELDGLVSHPAVEVSSGDDTLDSAMLGCEADRAYKPATIDGHPVVIRWRTVMTFERNNYALATEQIGFGVDLADSGATSVPSIGPRNSCAETIHVELDKKSVGKTSLSFTVTKDGTIADLRVAASSGSDMLDKAAMACAQNWRYSPAMKDGRPIDMPWHDEINWKFWSPRDH